MSLCANFFLLDKAYNAQHNDIESEASDIAMPEKQAEDDPWLAPRYNSTTGRLEFYGLNISLPKNDITESLSYQEAPVTFEPSGASADRYSIRSTKIKDKGMQTMTCEQPVRISGASATPFNPWEEYQLDYIDGKGHVMHVFAQKDYTNNQGSTKSCADNSWKEITPAQIADQFKDAQPL
ncbi:MAG: hypothetical protein QG629_722 [Patescibacteria group bacterium]|nr:hypothetical protein [Patescibacteria group bacterium]